MAQEMLVDWPQQLFFCPRSVMETSREPTKIAKGRNQPPTQIELINVKDILSNCLTLSGL